MYVLASTSRKVFVIAINENIFSERPENNCHKCNVWTLLPNLVAGAFLCLYEWNVKNTFAAEYDINQLKDLIFSN